MEKYLRKIVRGLISEMFDESVLKRHVLDRYNERIRPDVLNVGYEIGHPTPKAENIKIVGTSSISQSKKDEILKRISDVEKVDFRIGNTYGVKLYDLWIDPETVNYNSEEDKEDAKGKTLMYVISNKKGYSVGNEVWLATDENNNIPTLMFRRSNFPPQGRWDIVIDDFNKILQRDV